MGEACFSRTAKSFESIFFRRRASCSSGGRSHRLQKVRWNREGQQTGSLRCGALENENAFVMRINESMIRIGNGQGIQKMDGMVRENVRRVRSEYRRRV